MSQILGLRDRKDDPSRTWHGHGSAGLLHLSSEPGTGLISSFVTDTDTDTKGVYTSEELDGLGMMLLLAGHDATATVLGGVLNWMVHDPELFARLKENPDLVTGRSRNS